MRRLSLLLSILCLTSICGVRAEAADSSYVPDIETFLQIGSVGGASASRDGERVFFTSNMSGVSQLYRLTPEGWPYQLTVYRDGIDYYALAPDGRSAVVGASVGGNEQSQLIWIDGETGRPRQLTNAPEVQFGSVRFGNDERTIYYRSNEANGKDFYVYEMSVPDGKSRLVYQGEGHHSPGALSHDGRWLVVEWYESNENSELYLVDLTSGGTPKLLTKHKGKVIFSSAGFSPDDSKIFLLTNNNKEGLMRPAVLDVKSGKTSEPLPPSRWEIEDGAISPDGRFAALIYNEEGYGRLHLFDTDTFKELPVPPLDGIVDGPSFTANGSLLFGFSSPTQAPDSWRWDWNKQELRRLTNTMYAGIDPKLFRNPSLVKIKSYDGLEVPAFIYLSPGYKQGDKIPFIMDMHGGPESQFRPFFIRNFQYFILNGYGILAPNIRGSSGYGKEYLGLDNYKLRMNSVKDAGACARWLVEQGYTTHEMLGIRGGSYGGYMVLASITEFPELFAAAVDEVGVANFQTFLENTAEYRRALREAEYGPLTDPEFLKSVSPIHKVDKIRTPLLVIHGENDPRVPVGEARQIAAAISARGGVVDTLIFSDEGHGLAKRPNVLVGYRRQVDFFNQHLKK